jgi:hypothetical protein
MVNFTSPSFTVWFRILKILTPKRRKVPLSPDSFRKIFFFPSLCLLIVQEAYDHVHRNVLHRLLQRVEGTETDLNTALALSASLQEAIDNGEAQCGPSADDCFVVPGPSSALSVVKAGKQEMAGVSSRRRGAKQVKKT